jgi:hypothetical protein
MGLIDKIESIFGKDDDEPEAVEPLFEEEVLPEMAEVDPREEGDLRTTVESGQGGLEGLIAKIPGYSGYKEKELRREADKLLRTTVAAKLDDQRQRLSELQVQLISQAQIEYVDDLERAGMKLQLLTDRIKTASYGYAGLFDAVKVKEEQLDALYEFDNEMLDFVDEIAAGVDQVSSAIAAREGIGEAITDLLSVAEEANQAFGHREEAILQSVL